MIIKSLSKETISLAKKTRDLLEESSLETVILVPHDVRKIHIYEDEKSGLYTMILRNKNEVLDVVKGFLDYECCRNHAKAIAKEAGLSKKDIKF
jgi:hypothetical protein